MTDENLEIKCKSILIKDKDGDGILYCNSENMECNYRVIMGQYNLMYCTKIKVIKCQIQTK